MLKNLTMSLKSKLSINSTLTLPNSSITIPQLGFGVYLSAPDVCTASCLEALKAGYRHIDTAQYYENESEVGKAIKESGIPRSEIFVTTKILFAQGSVEKSYRACVESVEKIDARGKEGYVDLFLIHSPNFGEEKTREMWEALERVKGEGRARAIGVSNFGVGMVEEVKGYAKEAVAVNQIEVCCLFLYVFLLRLGGMADACSFILGVNNARLSPTAGRTILLSRLIPRW